MHTLLPPWLQPLLRPQPFLRRLVLLLALQKALLNPVLRGRAKRSLCDSSKWQRVEALKSTCPPPLAHEIGGEKIDTGTFVRFLSVNNWEVDKAAEMLEKDYAWRRKYRPRDLRPSDMQIMCRQYAWQVMMRDAQHDRDKRRQRQSRGRRRRSSVSKVGEKRGQTAPISRQPLHPSHTKPPLQQWRFTHQGMPLTFLEVANWNPELASHDERVKHVTYHMVRRAPPVREANVLTSHRASTALLPLPTHRARPACTTLVYRPGTLHKAHAKERATTCAALLHHHGSERVQSVHAAACA